MNFTYLTRTAVITLTLAFGVLQPTTLRAGNSETSYLNLQQKNITVAVKVTDVTDMPIVGATVFLESNTRISAATDVQGIAVLRNVPEEGTLEISFLGMVTQKIKINGRAQIHVTLKEDVKAIDEVVVVGYGKQKRSGMVSSVNTVTSKEIRLPTRNLTNNLAGQLAGLIAIQRSGEPGEDDASFWIRGVSTFRGGTAPLVLVDGVPRRMQDIEPDEIDTFSLLKDAAATAVYGAEGANGVILITTKRGRVERPKISFSAEHSIVTPTRLPGFLGSVEFMNAYNEALWNEGSPDIWTQEYISRFDKNSPDRDSDLYPNVNWLDLLNKTTSSTRATVSFQGGTEKARYFVGTSYYTESGIFKKNRQAEYNNNIGLDRFGLRSNIDLNVSNTTLLSLDVNSTYTELNSTGFPSAYIFRQMLTTCPNLFPMVYSDGTLAGHPQGKDESRQNPYNMLMNSGYQKEWRVNLQTKIALTQQLKFITEGLNARINVAFDANVDFNTERMKNPIEYNATGRDDNGKLIYTNVNPNGTDNLSMTTGASASKNIYIDASLNYNRTFNENHDVTAMFLYMQKDRQVHSTPLAYRKQSLVGRITYSYKSRYNFEGNFGYTGSENFAAGHRFGLFPAVGVSWYLSNEKFYSGKVKDILSKLKFRVSYGLTGNDATGGARFLFRGTIDQRATPYSLGWTDTNLLNSLSGIRESQFAAPNLTWEIETKRNYGIDIGMFNGKLDLAIDYFDNLREDILLRRQTIPKVTGFVQMPWQNFGRVQNRGFDASLVYNQTFGAVRLGFRANVTYARNKILEIDEVPPRYEWMARTGTRIGERYLLQADGFYRYEDFDITGEGLARRFTLKEGVVRSSYNANIRPGDLKYKDLNGSGVIENYDHAFGGAPPNPELVYGFGINVEYKGFYAGVFFQGAGSTSTVLGGYFDAGFFPFSRSYTQSSLRSFATDRWSDRGANGTVVEPRWDALYPRLSTMGNENNSRLSTHYLRDASFIRLKNAQVGYNFPKRWLSRIGVNSARVFCTGTNLAVWDKIKYWDPEMGNANEGLNYPLTMNISFGLEVVL
ncbi:SusC/RagA family TonB-linked outer membrane protein [Mucinivorans hirudinis]|uniref:SusC/RagA family TonB-linked outer membrane protein n=1 Tax=Mucinivorans hirudinis TaxID=1433126 RepID=A0A060R681_9BACT|nr:SusC/RagA family TonB-linked outer membrane protein [Mucinivorans hirudinis]CDN32492.1 SusC/RagA family TonB-linked outer membrane protein [Mucinivorans hirudinis]